MKCWTLVNKRVSLRSKRQLTQQRSVTVQFSVQPVKLAAIQYGDLSLNMSFKTIKDIKSRFGSASGSQSKWQQMGYEPKTETTSNIYFGFKIVPRLSIVLFLITWGCVENLFVFCFLLAKLTVFLLPEAKIAITSKRLKVKTWINSELR